MGGMRFKSVVGVLTLISCTQLQATEWTFLYEKAGFSAYELKGDIPRPARPKA